jgi:hypothetical protein
MKLFKTKFQPYYAKSRWAVRRSHGGMLRLRPTNRKMKTEIPFLNSFK